MSKTRPKGFCRVCGEIVGLDHDNKFYWHRKANTPNPYHFSNGVVETCPRAYEAASEEEIDQAEKYYLS